MRNNQINSTRIVTIILYVGFLFACNSMKSTIVSTVTSNLDVAQTEAVEITPTLQAIPASSTENTQGFPDPKYSYEEFLSWISEKNNCVPPCVWGITPGETTIRELKELLEPFGEIVEFERSDGKINYTAFIIESIEENQENYIEAAFIASGATIQEISLWARLIKPGFEHSVNNLLNEWGEPSEIWIQVNLDTQSEIPDYDLQIIFKEIPVLVWFTSVQLDSGESGYEICPQRIQGPFATGPGVHFWASESAIDINPQENLAGYAPLTEINPQFTSKTFFEVFKDPDAIECIQIHELD